MESLINVKAGGSYTIKWMFGNPQVMDLIRSYDIKEGSRIRVIQKRLRSKKISSNVLTF